VFPSFNRLIDSAKQSVASTFLILTGLMSSFWVVLSQDQALLFHITNSSFLFHQHRSSIIRCLCFITFCLNKYSHIIVFIWVNMMHLILLIMRVWLIRWWLLQVQVFLHDALESNRYSRGFANEPVTFILVSNSWFLWLFVYLCNSIKLKS